MDGIRSLASLLGRLALSAIFIFTGVQKIMYWDQTLQFMTSHNMTMVEFLGAMAVMIELGCGLGLFFGFKTRTCALLLALFLVPVTWTFHDFWNITDPQLKGLQTIHFFSNLAVTGGLLTVFAKGAGWCSIDGDCTARR